MKNKLLLLAVVVIVGALLYYCFNTGSKSEDVSAAAGETYKLEYTPTLKTYGFTEPVVLKAKPQRVVSLVHTPVLALHEMGIKQVAVPQAAMLEWPADLVKDAKLLNVSMNSNFDIESVIALEPDLVIVGYQSKDTYGKILDREKIPVYYVDAGHVLSYESIKELTDVLSKPLVNIMQVLKLLRTGSTNWKPEWPKKDRKIKGKKLWCCNQPRRVIIYRVKMVL